MPLNLKEQFVLEMVQQYETADRVVHAYENGVRNGTIPPGTPPPVLPPFNMSTMVQQHVPIDRVERIIMDELSVIGRPRALVVALHQSILTGIIYLTYGGR
jgi:hypothetical protein